MSNLTWTKHNSTDKQRIPDLYTAEYGHVHLRIRSRGGKHNFWGAYIGDDRYDSGTAESLERAKELAEKAAQEAAETAD